MKNSLILALCALLGVAHAFPGRTLIINGRDYGECKMNAEDVGEECEGDHKALCSKAGCCRCLSLLDAGLLAEVNSGSVPDGFLVIGAMPEKDILISENIHAHEGEYYHEG